MPKTTRPATDDAPRRGAQPGNDNAGTHHIYDTHFTDDELSRIIASLTDPAAGLDATVTATYVLLDRIIAKVTTNQEDLETFLRLVAAHNETTGRIASLLRSSQILNGNAADSLTGHIAAALDQLADQLHVEL